MSFFENSKVQLAAAIILPNLGGFVGAQTTHANLDTWYRYINKPSWNPPDYAFAPVWTALYSGIGYATYLVYRNQNPMITNDQVRSALLLYGGQLMLNWAWPTIFFKYHSLKWSAIEISVLTASAAACGWAYYNIDQRAGWLFVPYVAWLAFASLLNYKIYKLNSTDKSIKIDDKIPKLKDN